MKKIELKNLIIEIQDTFNNRKISIQLIYNKNDFIREFINNL